MARIKFAAGKVMDFSCQKGKNQAFIWDSKQSGLGVRATPTSKTYVFQDRLAGSGKTFRMTIGSTDAITLDDARTRASELSFQVSQGRDPRQVIADVAAEDAAKREESHRREFTLADVWPVYVEANKHRWGDRYLEDHSRYTQQGGTEAKRGKAITKPGPLWPLMNMKLSDLTPERVKAWAADESTHRATQCRNAFGALRACLNWCSDHPQYRAVVDVDACSSKVKRLSVQPKKAKSDCLQREQLAGWFNAVRQINNPIIKAYLQSALLTGARREEIAGLRWADVDFRWNSMTIKDKVEGLRVIPLTPYVASLLVSLPRRNAFVFSSPKAASGRLREPRYQHNKALAVAGIEELTIHGLRRSFGTLSEWVEVPAGVVAQIMGHKPSATAEKHYKVRPLDLLRMWHTKVETWILEQAGIEQPVEAQAQQPLTMIVGGKQ